MKVKPFYIKTSNLTEMQIASAIDLSVNHGADRCEGVDGINQDGYISPLEWVFFGVDGDNDTYFSDDSGSYGHDAIEITLDQLDAHLGIADSEEWKNGDECEHGHHNYSGANKMTYIGAHPFVSGKHVCLSELKGIVIVDSIWLRKPETQQQREERERLEAAYDLLLCAYPSYNSFESFRDDDTGSRDKWLAIVDKTGYRKEK